MTVMTQLWSVSKLNDVPLQIRRKLRFYAPLTESLDFMGVDPATFIRASASVSVFRDGNSHPVGPDVPRFEYDPLTQLPLGLKISAGETLQFNPVNELHSSDTLIWFEEATPKSTPTNSNPFNSSGVWIGNTEVHIKHIIKAISGMTLSASEINTIQEAAGDIAQSIPVPAPIIPAVGQFHTEIPGGTINGSNVTFTLTFEPLLASLLVFAHGGVLLRVASSPAELEFMTSGGTNQTLTLGLAPTTVQPFFVQYIRLS